MNAPSKLARLGVVALFSLPMLVALVATRGQAAPPTSDPTSGIRFSSPVYPWEVQLAPEAQFIGKFVAHAAQIYDCRSLDAVCGTGNDCSYAGHKGTDIRVNYTGDPTAVRAAAPGWVRYREDGHANTPDGGGFGNHVILDHGCGVSTIYGHMRNDGLANDGALLQCGDRLGWGAASGNVFGDVGYREHTHFEIQVGDAIIDPFAGACNPSSDISLWAAGSFAVQCQAQHPPACPTVPPPVDDSEFVSESAPYDGELIATGAAFSKTWTIRNLGNQPWTAADYRLVYSEDPDHYEGVTSNPMGGPAIIPLPVDASISTNGIYTFTVDLVAPQTPGRYRAAWTMENIAFAQTFDDGFWVDIEVVGDPQDPGYDPDPCATTDYGTVDHGTCWQVDFPSQCGWLRCEDGHSLAVDDLDGECGGQRLLRDGCQKTGDHADWAGDLLVRDDAIVLAGTRFEKRWRVRNSGDTSWDAGVVAGYTADYAQLGGTNYEALGYGKTQAGGPTSVALGTTVAPGETYDLAVVLTAPTTPGRYVSAWQMQRNGQPFGDYLWLLYEVVAAPGGPCVVEYSDSSASVGVGTCVQSDRSLDYQPEPACGWQRCSADGTWAQGTLVNQQCSAGGGYPFPSCINGDGNPSGWTGWCPGPYCDGGGGGGGGGGNPPPPDPPPDPAPCPCSADPNVNNFCYYGVNNPECPPTQPGGYCDPNGDGSFDDGDWDKGYYDYLLYCGG